MNRILCALTLSLTAAGFSQIAAANSVTLEPGLYDYSNVISFAGMEMPADTSEYCIIEGENSKTFDELAASFSGDAQCELSDVVMTSSTGKANFLCSDTPLGMDIGGTLESSFGPDFYDVDSRAKVGMMGEILVQTKVRRRGDCPAEPDVAEDNADNNSVR